MKKIYQVFISSTYTDLVDERKAVLNAVLGIHLFPVGMEHFNASSAEQWETIRDEIDTSDYYVLILGKRYGTVIADGEDAGLSYTEKEFNYALSKGVPILAFIKSDDASYKPSWIETDSGKIAKLAAFTEKVKNGRIVKWFENAHELASEVTAALHAEISKNERPGWIRGDQIAVESKIDELIGLLREEYGLDVESADGTDPDEPVSEYEFRQFRTPTDGKHRQIGFRGDVLAEGEWKDGRLEVGTEYDWLIRVTRGKLIFKPDCPEDPYDSTDDFQYKKLEQYGERLTLSYPFGSADDYIIECGLDGFYVVDMEVNGDEEQMFNIRTLRDFLKDNAPDSLELYLDLTEEN